MVEFRRERSYPVGSILGSIATVVGVAGALAFSAAQCQQIYVDSYLTSWTNSMKDRISGKTPLLVGEKRYDKVKVKEAGETLADALDMKQNRILVNVRDFAGIYYPNIGIESRIIGKIAIGDTAYDVVLTPTPYAGNSQYWGVTSCDKVEGLVLTDPTQPKPDLCAINANYLKKAE